MAMVREIRRRARQIAPQVLFACIAGYFAYHAVQGDRGLLAYIQLQQRLDQAKAVDRELDAQRAALQRKVQLLRLDSLDLDMLEERSREVLNYTREDEVVVMTRPGASPDRDGSD
jgi:cell division protein FtsB